MTNTDVLTSIIPFCDAGFALHWLHPRAKSPIGKNWQEMPVASLDSLRRSYAAGNNLGVRLGEPSHLASGFYLHVIDLDIRIAEQRDEAWQAFAELFPGVDLATFPLVASGSGGESRHVYLITDKPFFSKLLAASEGKHRRDKIDSKTGTSKSGWSHDWEIEIFGTGKQVVMPPSIHPDTGKPYIWLQPFDFDMLAIGFGPYIPAEQIEALGAVDQTTYEFESRDPLTFRPGQLESELDLIPVSDLHYDDWIRLGQALHHQLGASEEGWQLWLKHTRRSKKYDGDDRTMRKKWRSFGRYRGQPVTMATIRQWALEVRRNEMLNAFDEEPEGGDEIAQPAAIKSNNFDSLFDKDAGEPAGDAQEDVFDALLGGKSRDSGDAQTVGADPFDDLLEAAKPVDPADRGVDWKTLFDFNEEGAIKPTLHNVELIIKNDPRLIGLPQINEFTQEVVQRTPPGRQKNRRRNAVKEARQLEGRVWEVKDTLNGDLWSDDRDFAVRSILEAPASQGGYGIKVSDRDLRAATVLAGNVNSFHPIREYLGSLTWDGTSRCETLFIRYLGAPDNAYHRSTARLMMIAAVTRVMEPGHKWDFAVILEGLQGKRKSTFIETLGRRWFSELDGDFHDPKQMVELMQGAWIMEIPELTGFSRADVRSIKAFISRKSDKVRLAYARRAAEFPRQCIFIGSTNDREYLKDDTGGRRFWPIVCLVVEINIERLQRETDQLWAEAVTLYRQMRADQPHGTLPLYLTDPEAHRIAARLQESRRVESADEGISGRIADWLDRPVNSGGLDDDPHSDNPVSRNETCLLQIWCEALSGNTSTYNQGVAQQIGRAMKFISNWENTGSWHNFPAPYGRQRLYSRTYAIC